MWVIVGIYAVLTILTHVPAVQRELANVVATALSEKLGTKVEVERVDLGFLNRITIDGFHVYDQQQKEMLSTTRLASRIDIIPLFEGRIQISSAQIFGMKADIYHLEGDSILNCQFAIDSLSSKDNTEPSEIDLRIASLVIRNGQLKYEDWDISQISSHIIIYDLNSEKIKAEMKKLSFVEASGLKLDRLAFNIDYTKAPNGNQQSNIELSDFNLQMPHTSIRIPRFTSTFSNKGDKIDLSTVALKGNIDVEKLSLKDLQSLIKAQVSHFPTLSLKADINGNSKLSHGKIALNSIDKSVDISLNYLLRDMFDELSWEAENLNIRTSSSFTNNLNETVTLPEAVLALGDISLNGNAKGTLASIFSDIKLTTQNAGSIEAKGSYDKKTAKVDLTANEIDLGIIAGTESLGKLNGKVSGDATFNGGKLSRADAKCHIDDFTALNYTYHDINVNGNMNGSNVDISINSNDENLTVHSVGSLTLSNGKLSAGNIKAEVANILPNTLNLSDEWGNSKFNFNIASDFTGTSLDNLEGTLCLSDFTIFGAHKSLLENEDLAEIIPSSFTLNDLTATTHSSADGRRSTTISSDFCDISVYGHYKLSTIPESFLNLLRRNLSSIPGIGALKSTNNDFTFNAKINSLQFLRIMTGMDIALQGNAQLKGYLNDGKGASNLYAEIPSLKLSEYDIENFKFLTWNPDSMLYTTISSSLTTPAGNKLALEFGSQAHNDILRSNLKWNSKNGGLFAGHLNTTATSITAKDGKPGVRLSIEPSDIQLEDSVWHLHSRDIVYSANNLSIDHFAIENLNQHVYVNGVASKSADDVLTADLKNVNIEYIMNLVNFHSVEFAGFASGRAVGKELFGTPDATAHLDVSEFCFEGGHLGTLSVDAKLNNIDKQIDVDGVAKDSISEIIIKGFVSPQRDCIDLDLTPNNTRLEFMQTYCSSFLDNVDMYGTGRLRLAGPFSKINLTGEVIAKGEVDVTTLNCHYTLPGDTVKFVPNDIQIQSQKLLDKNGNVAYLSGGLHHEYLSRMTYDFDITARNFLAYDFKDFGEQTFYGTAYLTGNCFISGRSSELNVTVEGLAERGSFVVYDASSPDNVTNQEFINWGSASAAANKKNNSSFAKQAQENEEDENADVRTNIHMNFQFNVTDESTLRILMDRNTGDYIDFNGSADLHAQYYNKGSFDLFGNYNITKGLYHMTIQNFITRDFEFQPGSVISFNGAPFSAALNLKALYSLTSVPLSGLNIGQSFSNNNVHVDCLLDITGTAGAPKVDFDFDLPNINTDVKQMIYSLVNSEEEMKQQVVYLLAVGRFYSQGSNNAEVEGENYRTNQAMQSILSGTISQQLANALGAALNSSKWTVGANISPGNEGFSNAEYEGVFSGSLLSNRLLINGQLGYRDNAATSTQGFIGDFDIRYLLTPNGNVAIKVYNQANDRYFIRNSLNTQGIGLVLKTDFSSWKDFFRKKKK